ncbi:hypothetical protein DVK07_12440 [Halorubrum sp. Atlit-26R]|nr:hypothetical protein DVK07_12440 [Halorubrum sp. Atlit-26R]
MSGANERGAHRAARVLATGALEEFTADPLLAIYKRAAADSEAFTANLRQVSYNRAAGALEVFATDSAVTYKHLATTPKFYL